MCSARKLDVIVNLLRERLKATASEISTKKTLKGQQDDIEKHIYNLNLFNTILPVMKTDKLKLN